jgi:hypothetical protein
MKNKEMYGVHKSQAIEVNSEDGGGGFECKIVGRIVL